MKTTSICNNQFIEGTPKICIPIVETTEETILQQAQKIKQTPADCIEWRCDFYQQCHEKDAVLETMKKLREICQKTPLIFTFRTIEEGGERAIDQSEYETLLLQVSQSQYADFIDVEYQRSSNYFLQQIKQCTGVIVSYHNFHETPSKKVILELLSDMNEMPNDFVKIALMPDNEEDVEKLLEVTKLVKNEMNIIAISMGELGKRSRLSKGTCMTFASLDQASAPGQIPLDELIQKL